MTKYRPEIKCPNCRSYPNTRFSEDAVREARSRPQMQLVQELTCQHCGCRYWLPNHAIINARPDREQASAAPQMNGARRFPFELPPRAAKALEEAGIHNLEQLLRVEDLGSIPGIGPSTARTLRRILEAKGLTRPRALA